MQISAYLIFKIQGTLLSLYCCAKQKQHNENATALAVVKEKQSKKSYI